MIITAECSTAKAFLFGCRNSISGDNQGRYAYYLAALEKESQTNPQFGNRNYVNYKNAADLSQKTTIKFSINGFYQNNIKICDFLDATGSATNQYSIFLLSCNTSGTHSQPCMKAKIYNCKIYDNDVLVRDMIPVLDKNDVACMYDKVNKKFYYNQGTGVFLYQEKDNYTELEYLESTGTQYIDTEYICSKDTKIEIDFAVSAYSIFHSLFGIAGNQAIKCFVAQLYKIEELHARIGSGLKRIPFEFEIGQRYILIQSKQTINVNGTELGNWTNDNVPFGQDADSLFLMAIRNKTATNAYTYLFKGRTYGFKIYESNILAMDLVPTLDSNNTPCMYDKVNSKFYYNQRNRRFLVWRKGELIC